MQKHILRSAFLFFVFNLLFIPSHAQAPGIEWQKCLGGAGYERANSIIQATDGGYVVAGVSQSNDSNVTGNHGGPDYWIVKLSNTGVKQWAYTYGGTGEDAAYSIIQTNDGGYVVAGFTSSNDNDVLGNHGGTDYLIIKLNSAGVKQWAYTYGGTGEDGANSIIQTTDGGYAAAGYTTSNDSNVIGNHGYADYWIVKLSSSGVKQWEHTYGGSEDDFAFSILQTTDGGYAVAGYTESNDGDITGNHGGSDCWIVKLSSSGVKQWGYAYGGSGVDWAKSLIQTTDNGYTVAGYSQSNDGDVTGNHGGWDYWIYKLSSAGAKLWDYSYGGSRSDEANSIIQTNDGGYAVSGYTLSNDGDVTGNHSMDTSDVWIIKMNSTGVKEWAYSYGGTERDGACSIIQTTDGGFALAGNTRSSNGDVSANHGGDDYWIVKLSPDTATGVDKTANDLAFSIYPNPAGSSVSISIDESMAGSNLTVTDVTGRVIMNDKLLMTNVQLPVADLASGIYFIKVENEKGRVTKKLIKE